MDQRRIIEAQATLDEAFALHKPTHVFGLFSGGHDSLTACHVASKHPAFSGVAHMNTTIGIEETRVYARETAASLGWKFNEYFPPVSYEDIVMEHGFPGPGGHFYMYVRLKERCLDQLVREHKKRRMDRIMLVTGVRLDESDRRMGHVEAVVRARAKVWVAPILNWSTEDKNDYIALHKLPRNPVVDRLCMSGECLCGAFAHPGEMVEIEEHYPATAARIRQIEVAARARGVHAKWGTRPPKEKPQPKPLPMEMCWSCEAKQAQLDLREAEALWA